MTNYPIIDQRSLPKAQRGGPWGLGPRTRPVGDIPLPNAHEVVVYKSGGVYVIDDGRSRLDDDHVRNATNISVVDMRVGAPVKVHVSIPSRGGAEFNIQVTFLCTVRKADEVVDSGLQDMEEPLTHYLEQHQPLFHAGEDLEFDDINTVRLAVEAEIRAYSNVRPPRFRGIDVAVGSVKVLTPEEYAEFERERRERRRKGVLSAEEERQSHELTQERQQLQQVRDRERQRFDHELHAQVELNNQQLAEIRRQHDEQMELQKHKYEQLMAEMRQQMDHTLAQRQLTHDHEVQRTTLEHDQQIGAASLEHGQRMQAATIEHEQRIRSAAIGHAIDGASRLGTAIGAEDSEIPRLLAAAAGEVTMSETAEQLSADRVRSRDSAAGEAVREKTWAREDTMQQKAWAREDTMQEKAWAREDTRDRLLAERKDAELKYTFKLHELQAQMEILKAGISRGLADHQTIDKIMGVITGAVKELQGASITDQSGAAATPAAGSERGQAASASAAASDQQPRVDGTVIDAEIVSEDEDLRGHVSSREDSAIREEDIGR